MNAYMTNGTIEYLEKLADQHPQFEFFIMNSVSSTVAYYEDAGKNIFNSGREYEILIKSGDIQMEGFVVLNNIPLTAEGSRSEEHTSELQSRGHLVCRLLLEKKKELG